MQSKTAFVLLGLLKEKPMNPYEIVKIINRLNISQWSPISTSSVYMTIKTLENKGLIKGKKERASAMPEKTIYEVTAIGEAAFTVALKEYMSDNITDITKFNLSTLFICHLDQSEVVCMLKDRAACISKNYEETQLAYNKYKNKLEIPDYALLSLKHNINFYLSELSSVEAMIEEIAGSEQWDHFLTSNLK